MLKLQQGEAEFPNCNSGPLIIIKSNQLASGCEIRKTNREFISVVLRGGLGNQLLQYSAGFALSRQLDKDLILDSRLCPPCATELGGVTIWPEEISSFQHAGEIRYSHNKTASTTLRRLYQLERLIGDTFGTQVPAIWGAVASEREQPDPVFFSSDKKIKRLNSHFASDKYWAAFAEEVTGQVNDPRNPTDFYLRSKKEIVEDNSVAVHLRLGDYRNLSHVYGRLSESYFVKAKNLIASHDKSTRFWVFSDEPQVAKGLLNDVFPGGEFVSPPKSSRPIESLLLISQAKHKILSNSTFSWWAAFLDKSLAGLTIFPEVKTEFFTSSIGTKLLRQNWITLDHS